MDWNDIKKNPVALLVYTIMALIYLALLIGICII
jgi:hypothetical protein